MSENSIKTNETLSVFDRAWFEVFPPLNAEDEALYALNRLYIGRALTFLGLQRGVGYLYLKNKKNDAVSDDNPTPFRVALYSLAEKNFVRLTQLEPSSARLFFKVVPLVLFNYAVVAPATAVANFVALITVFPVALVMNAFRRAAEKKEVAVPEVKAKPEGNPQFFNSGELHAAFPVEVCTKDEPQLKMLGKNIMLTKEELVYYGELLGRFIAYSGKVKNSPSVNNVNKELLQGLDKDIERLKAELIKGENARKGYVYECEVLMKGKVEVLILQSEVPFFSSPSSPTSPEREVWFPSPRKK